jgi:hypothetical protein
MTIYGDCIEAGTVGRDEIEAGRWAGCVSGSHLRRVLVQKVVVPYDATLVAFSYVEGADQEDGWLELDDFLNAFERAA